VAPLRAGKRVPLAGAAAQVALLGFFTLTVALYAVPVLAIVLVVPADRLTGLTGFIDAHLPDGFVGQRLVFTVAELVPLGLVPLAAFLLARTRRSPAR
jgi:hypothetical protein